MQHLVHAPIWLGAGAGGCLHSAVSVHTRPLQTGIAAPQVLHGERGVSRGERRLWTAPRLCLGPLRDFAGRQLGVPVLVAAHVCKPGHPALDNMPITWR